MSEPLPLEHAHQTHDDHRGAHVHVVPLKFLFFIYGALLFFTVVTVAVTWIDLDQFNVWLALGIALIKAALVAMYFMHLRWDAPFNGIILLCALLFVAIFVGIAVLDSREYRVNYEPPQSGSVMSVQHGR